jgi:hypothetical protein
MYLGLQDWLVVALRYRAAGIDMHPGSQVRKAPAWESPLVDRQSELFGEKFGQHQP